MAVIQVRGDLDQDGHGECDEKSLDYIQNVELKVFANVKSESEEARMNPKAFGLHLEGLSQHLIRKERLSGADLGEDQKLSARFEMSVKIHWRL